MPTKKPKKKPTKLVGRRRPITVYLNDDDWKLFRELEESLPSSYSRSAIVAVAIRAAHEDQFHK